MKRLFLTISMIATLSGCSEETDAPVALAQVGDEVITLEHYQREMALRDAMRPGYYQLAENREELLQYLVNLEVQLQAARRAGIPEERDFKELYERMLIQRLREKRLEEALDAMSISNADILSYYEANASQFSRPERRQVALVRIDRPAVTDEETDAALMARANEAREKALALDPDPGHFGRVAVEYSADRGSRYQGGVVGWLVDADRERYQLDSTIIDAAFELPAGQISPVIETAQAYWLLRVVTMEPARQQPLEQVRDGIEHRLTRLRAQALEDGLVEQLRSETSISINSELLDTVPIPTSVAPESETMQQDRRPPPLPGGAGSNDEAGSAEN